MAWFPRHGKRWDWEELGPYDPLRGNCSVVHQIARFGRPRGFRPTQDMPWWTTRPQAFFRWFSANDLQRAIEDQKNPHKPTFPDRQVPKEIGVETLPWLLSFGDPEKVCLIFDFV